MGSGIRCFLIVDLGAGNYQLNTSGTNKGLRIIRLFTYASGGVKFIQLIIG